MSLKISEEERERRRERARRMHAEVHPDDPTRRRFGGAQPNSGPRRQKRATEVAAERIARNGNRMADAVLDAMAPDKPSHVRLTAVKVAMDIEHREALLHIQEEREHDDKSNAELVEMLMKAAQRAVESGAVARIKPEDVIEGVVVES